jgi:biotin-dependent carboxylase-like uncharacterized protein
MPPDGQHLLIESPGLFTTVQDLGRPGLARFGVSQGGALDREALILGNRLVGNQPEAAALECTLSGPVIQFERDQVIAITGADLGPALDGAPVHGWQPVLAQAGSRLSFAASPPGAGARAYIAVAGGIGTPLVLGSRSTDLVGHFGGVQGRAVQAGDRIPVGTPLADAELLLRRRLAFDPPAYSNEMEARVTPGPQEDRFTDAGLAAFPGSTYQVTSKADRTGIRLAGPRIEHRTDADLISEGIAHGAIQVPGDGQPIVLLAARQTVGGYVKIATVIGADLDRLGQARPGNQIRFTPVSIETARSAMRAARQRLGPAAIIETPRVHPVGQGLSTMSDSRQPADPWTPDGVIRIIAEAERAGVTHLRLEVASAGITLDLTRGTAGLRSTTTDDSAPLAADTPADDTLTITAPLLGTFYRRRTPEEPPLAEAGQAVGAGALIGLIEVMKTYHEITAPAAGTITGILVEDGHYVEYGQPLALLQLHR